MSECVACQWLCHANSIWGRPTAEGRRHTYDGYDAWVRRIVILSVMNAAPDPVIFTVSGDCIAKG